jgi:hypothetical protein
MKGVDHKGRLGDGVTNVVKKIGELLEPAEVVIDGQIGLERVVELLQGIHGALVYGVEEETLERRLERVRRRLAEEHHLYDLRRHKVVEPRHNALIDLKPLSVMPHSMGIDGSINMVDDAKLALHMLKLFSAKLRTIET